MAIMPNSDPLTPETAHMLHVLEASLDSPPLPCVFRCVFCHNPIALGHNFIQVLFLFCYIMLCHPVIRVGQFVLACGGGVRIEVVFPM
ncbi:hypothetical protein PVL29_019407 [Vitis rotundifolia]|uniref:Yippee domain-containing protein n=1 Tax=Vitis rotundifolia TaxID=103349 RepID=A0AA39DDJ8_VITRO|nr:hypothetical protein PVL29_019407 [Vitis rotundifolia]